MEWKQELVAKAKNAETVEELMKLAKKEGLELSTESAASYFELLHPQEGEISDEELDNVSGGNCYKGNRMVVTAAEFCDDYMCSSCGSEMARGVPKCSYCHKYATCVSCHYCTYEKGLWLCNNPIRMK